MIKTKQQKTRTLDSIKKLEAELNVILSDDDIDNIIKKMHETSYLSLIQELKAEVEEYDNLIAGNYEIPKELDMISLLKNLTKIRIFKGLSQSDLANKLEIDRQQINRYEEHDYQTASWERIVAILEALDMKEEINLVEASKTLTPIESTEQMESIFKDLESLLCRSIKQNKGLNILSVCVGIDILKRKTEIGFLVKGSNLIDSFIESFKEGAESIFISHQLEKFECEFTVIMAISPKKDKAKLISSLKAGKQTPVRELIQCAS